MTNRDTDIVSAFRSLLCERLGQDRFDLWFADVEFTVVQTTAIRLVIPNAFSLEQIRKTFRAELNECLQMVLGKGATFELQVIKEDRTPSNEKEHQCSSATLMDKNPPIASCDKEKSSSRDQSKHRTPGSRRFAKMESLVVGDCNRLAYHSADLVMQQSGQLSPFLVYGPSGCGKTHLLEGIWSHHRKHRQQKQARVVYVTAEQFTTYFLQALRGDGLPSFRHRYRQVDLLIVDDIQFFAGKQTTTIELLHTIDSNLRLGAQIVFSSDRSPAELDDLGPDLVARLSSGLACEMKPLDAEVRYSILKRMAADRQIAVTDSVLSELADSVPGDGRQLAGLLNRLWVSSQVLDEPVDETMTREVVRELFPTGRTIVRLADIEKTVCDEFGIDPSTLKSNKRSRDISHPRMLAMWLARKHTRAGLTEISEFFGRRSHSTVLSAQNKVDEWVKTATKMQCATRSCDVRDVLNRIESSLKTA